MSGKDPGLAAHGALADALLGARPLHDLLAAVYRLVGVPVAVLDPCDGLLAGVPSRVEWPTGEIGGAASGPEGTVTAGCLVLPVAIEGEPVAALCARGAQDHRALLEFAATLAGIELSRRNAEMRGRRELVAQVLEDLFSGSVADADVSGRLARHGFDPDGVHRVLLGQADCTRRRLAAFPWNLHALLSDRDEPYLRAIVGNRIVVVAPDEAAPHVARSCLDNLGRLGPNARVGVGGPHRGVPGVRLSHLEAREAMREGPGIHEHRPRDLATVLFLAAIEAEVPLYVLSKQALGPLLDHDQRHHADLVRTLFTYLKAECSASVASAELFIHRNTLRHRLRVVEELTGRRLDSPATLLHFWVATTAWTMGPDADPATLLVRVEPRT